ncbi:hypothetical protein niasHT_014763 [Heterodera trifolii]|uniref:Uncharacterized protein n=1 Tax=Heterodera trifolii TaxID=157864 RepID=A0ABD2L6M1_9BILA
MKKINNDGCFLLVRCPISRDETKWKKWEEEAIEMNICGQWNKIDIGINEEGIGDGLLYETLDPTDQQK